MKKHLIAFIILFVAWQMPQQAQAQKKGDPLYTAPLGVQAYTFRKSFPNGVEATLDTIASLGFTELEGGAPRGMTGEEYRKLCEARGISIPGTGSGYDQLVKDPQAVADNAKALGAKFVMCAWIPHKRAEFNLENAQKAVEDFNKAGKVLKENGLTFCYHVHGYEFQPYGKGTLMNYIIENTNPEYVSFEMDIMWTHFGGGDPVKLLKKYGDRWKLLHVKDLKKGTPKDLTGGTGPENDAILGQGEVDIVGILKEANKIGIKHMFIEDESPNPMLQVPQSIAYLKSLRY
ncbi:MAG: sugar phosphate isomerase/epimerase [Imperialibacter sp.]|uniref:sugar phosphate isomerase/epimerase family protein n=1 Tax=Imperialibacter sp. TaxID=2038411 RepID=UPI0032ECA46C